MNRFRTVVRPCLGAALAAIILAVGLTPVSGVTPASAGEQVQEAAAPTPATAALSDDLPALERMQVTVLQRDPTGKSVRALDINERGEVAGTSGITDTHETDRATRWNADGTIADVWGIGTSAVAINDVGTMIGSIDTGDSRESAVAWKNGMEILLPDDGKGSIAKSINVFDQIVGAIYVAGPNGFILEPVLWTLEGTDATIQPLPIPDGFDSAIGTSINYDGDVLISTTAYWDENSEHHPGAWRWTSGDKTTPILEAEEAVALNSSSVALINGWTTGHLHFAGLQEEPLPRPVRLDGQDDLDDRIGQGLNDYNDVVGQMSFWFGHALSYAVIWPEGTTNPLKLDPLLQTAPGFESERVRNVYAINNTRSILFSITEEWFGGGEFAVMTPHQYPADLVDAHVESMDYPSNEWQDMPARGVVQGTKARIRVDVRNPDTQSAHVVSVELRNAETGQRMPDGYWFESLDSLAAETAEIEFDTADLAFDENGSPRPPMPLEFVVKGDGEEVDRYPFEVPVLPDPVVLVHGFNSNAAAWTEYGSYFESLHPGWQSFAVGDGRAPGVMDTGSLAAPDTPTNTLAENAAIMAEYVEGVRELTDAPHIDIVAHSTGGLISRQYINDWMPMVGDGKPLANQLIMLGTPNAGSPCASILSLAGMRHLRPDVIADFNERITNRKGVEMSILYGTYVPFNCQTGERGDGVVGVSSALTGGWDDNANTFQTHTELTNRYAFDFFVWPELLGGGPRVLATESADTASAEEEAAAPTESLPPLAFSRTETLAAGESRSIPVTVDSATRLGATFVAVPEVTAVLRAPDGDEIASTDAGAPIRTVSTVPGDEVTTGEWTLELTNMSDQRAQVPVAVFLNDSPTRLVATATVDGFGVARVEARLATGDQTATGATATARYTSLNGNSGTFTLFPQPDGTLRGSRGIPTGDYLLTVQAGTGAVTRATILDVSVGDVSADSTKPTMTVQHRDPDGGDWYRDSVDVRLSAADAQSGVQVVSYELHGAAEDAAETDQTQLDLTIAGEGSTELWWFTRDNAGNFRRNDAAVQFRVDASAPLVAVEGGIDGAIVEPGAQLNFSFSCSDALSGIAVCESDLANGSPLPTSEPGVHTVQVTATDTVGHVTERTVTYTVTGDVPADTTAPEASAVVVEQAENGWHRSAATVRIGAADSGSGVATIGWRVGDGPEQSTAAVSADVTIDASGRSVVQYWATDLAGNVATPATIEVAVDPDAPSIESIAPADGSRLALGDVVSLDVMAGDELSGLARIESVVRVPGASESVPLERGDAVPSAEAGTHELTVRAIDLAGNETVRVVEYVVDAPAPDVTPPTIDVTVATPAGGWFAGPGTAVLRASDGDGSGVDTVFWQLGGSSSGSGSARSAGAEVLVEREGVTTLDAWAVDAAGNESEHRQVELQVDLTAPTAELEGVEDGARFEVDEVPVAVYSCTDVLSGIAVCGGSVADGERLASDVGEHTVTVAARDRAGNEATHTVRYSVLAGNAPNDPGASPGVGERTSSDRPLSLAESGLVVSLYLAAGLVVVGAGAVVLLLVRRVRREDARGR